MFYDVSTPSAKESFKFKHKRLSDIKTVHMRNEK